MSKASPGPAGAPEYSTMKANRFLAIAAPALAGLALLGGCATKRSAPANYVMFPGPPDEPRVQYLWSFGAESDLGGRSKLGEFVVGRESIHRPIIKPYGLAIRDGRIYVCDTQGGSVIIADLKTRRFRYLKPEGQAAFKLPLNVAVDRDGTIYVTDTGREQVLILNPAGDLIGQIGGKGEIKPSGIVLTETQILITDLKNSCVSIYDKQTRQMVRSFPAKTGEPEKRLFQPTNLALDPQGNICVSDSGGFAVKIFDPAGQHLKTVGELGVTPGQFALPKGIGVDRAGRMYVLDAAAPVIQLFDEQARLLMYFGQPSTSGAGGLYLPAGLAIDYENTGLFEKFAAPGQKLEYLILVVNQAGPKKVSVYGFLKK